MSNKNIYTRLLAFSLAISVSGNFLQCNPDIAKNAKIFLFSIFQDDTSSDDEAALSTLPADKENSTDSKKGGNGSENGNNNGNRNKKNINGNGNNNGNGNGNNKATAKLIIQKIPPTDKNNKKQKRGNKKQRNAQTKSSQKRLPTQKTNPKNRIASVAGSKENTANTSIPAQRRSLNVPTPSYLALSTKGQPNSTNTSGHLAIVPEKESEQTNVNKSEISQLYNPPHLNEGENVKYLLLEKGNYNFLFFDCAAENLNFFLAECPEDIYQFFTCSDSVKGGGTPIPEEPEKNIPEEPEKNIPEETPIPTESDSANDIISVPMANYKSFTLSNDQDTTLYVQASRTFYPTLDLLTNEGCMGLIEIFTFKGQLQLLDTVQIANESVQLNFPFNEGDAYIIQITPQHSSSACPKCNFQLRIF